MKTHIVQISQRNLRTCFFYYIVLLSKPVKSCPKVVQNPKNLSRFCPEPRKSCPDVVQHQFSKTIPKLPQTPTTTRGFPISHPKTRIWTRWTSPGQRGRHLPSFWTKFQHKRLGTPNNSHQHFIISHLILMIAGQNHSSWTKSGQNKNTLSCEILKQNARVSTL